MLYSLFCFLNLTLVLAELGLSSRSSIPELDGKTVRVVDGRLTLLGDGPVLQAFFEDEKLVISSKLISASAIGSGVGLSPEAQLIVSRTPATGFYNRGGWLEYQDSPVFRAYNTDFGWEIFANNDDHLNGYPVMLQVANVVYETSGTPIKSKTTNINNKNRLVATDNGHNSTYDSISTASSISSKRNSNTESYITISQSRPNVATAEPTVTLGPSNVFPQIVTPSTSTLVVRSTFVKVVPSKRTTTIIVTRTATAARSVVTTSILK